MTISLQCILRNSHGLTVTLHTPCASPRLAPPPSRPAASARPLGTIGTQRTQIFSSVPWWASDERCRGHGSQICGAPPAIRPTGNAAKGHAAFCSVRANDGLRQPRSIFERQSTLHSVRWMRSVSGPEGPRAWRKQDIPMATRRLAWGMWLGGSLMREVTGFGGQVRSSQAREVGVGGLSREQGSASR